MERGKKFLLVQILSEIKAGKNPAQISKKLKISKQNLNYYVGKLKKEQCIKKKGYGVWEYVRPLKRSKKSATTPYDKHSKKVFTSSPKKEIRGHAFIWKIRFFNPIDWEQTIKAYKKKKLNFQLMKHNKIFRTIFNNRKIWCGKTGLTIYDPMDFMGKSSFEAKGKAVFEMDQLVKGFLSELGLKIRPYQFATSREHYGIIKNELARQYNDKKEKMEIRSADGSIWMWIDDSHSLGELENNEATVNRKVQNFWNDHKKHNFGVDASFVLNGFAQTNSQLQYFGENMVSHVAAVQELAKGVKELRQEVRKLSTHTK